MIQTHNGGVLSKVTNDVDTLGQQSKPERDTAYYFCDNVIGVLVMMLSISPLMTLVAL